LISLFLIDVNKYKSILICYIVFRFFKIAINRTKSVQFILRKMRDDEIKSFGYFVHRLLASNQLRDLIRLILLPNIFLKLSNMLVLFPRNSLKNNSITKAMQ
jgi:hypothetical protein